MRKNAAATAQITDFLRVYYAETADRTPARIAYNRAEAWHFGEYEAKRFKNYEVFRNAKSRHLKKIRRQKPPTHTQTPSKHHPESPQYHLFNQLLTTYIATEALRQEWREKWILL